VRWLIGSHVAWVTWLLSPPALAGDAPEDGAAEGIDDTLNAAEADDAESPKQRLQWNELDLKLFTVRIGGGLLLDWATFLQDAASHEQMPLEAGEELRDFRFVFNGKFLFWPRLSWTFGYMFDGPTQTWRVRQTGLLLDVPALDGELFIGRTKEGFSTAKIMVGYSGWSMERAAASDALLPILADGVKWTGRALDNELVYNVGWFIDKWSETESFNKNDKQFVGRVVWLPLAPTKSKTVLHLATEVRFAGADNGSLQYRSKPESFIAQSYAVDTGKFAATSATTIGFEAYYRPGPLMFGSEYYLNQVASEPTGNPFFHGGEVFASYLFTQELHPYNERGAFFEAVSPSHPVFAGGLGAWELVLRGSYVDLDSGTINGGKFWRITPTINWYLSNNVRIILAYGYSQLDRFGVTEPTQYVQSRLQLSLM
jgi:phosphate-selective porin OprO/OprP